LKLRIRDNSIRLRLSRVEVERLRDDGVVSASTHFSAGLKFRYNVESNTSCRAPEANFSGDMITVSLPAADVLAWSSSEQVSIRGEQRLDDSASLHILVEKDFACLQTRPGEDESELFANPDANPAKCQ